MSTQHKLLLDLRSLTLKVEITTKIEKRVRCVVPTTSYRSLSDLQKRTTNRTFLHVLRALRARRFLKNRVDLRFFYGNLNHKKNIFLD